MSDYTGKTRTNYFSVTDVEKFKHVISSCRASDEIIIFDEKQEDGSLKYGFYCFGEIHGLPDKSCADAEDEDDDVDYDYDYDAFCQALQGVLPNDEAIFITEAGFNNIRYLIGNCTIITKNGFECISIKREALKIARAMMSNPEFDTKMDY